MATIQFAQNDSQKIILIAMTVIIISALIERYAGTVKETATLPQIFVGAFIATGLLLLLSYVLPEFAVGLAVVAATTMLISQGQPFWAAINQVLKFTGGTNAQQTGAGGFPVTSTSQFNPSYNNQTTPSGNPLPPSAIPGQI